MTSPLYFKRGWDREKLAEYILSRISFVAKPATVSDDLGGDFYCTLFSIECKDGREYPLPLCSFAVQIKSKGSPLDFSPNINYLNNLEIPFFWGILDEESMSLSFYSGENLPIFFSHVGEVKTLKIKAIKRNLMTIPYDPNEGGKENYTVMFPFILSIKADSKKEDLKQHVEKLKKMCSFIHGNISTRKNEEYIFSKYNENQITILAGPGSAKQFRNNFMKRLAENFYNLKYIYESYPEEKKRVGKNEIAHEFHVYEKTYLKVKKIYRDVPFYPNAVYESLKKIIG